MNRELSGEQRTAHFRMQHRYRPTVRRQRTTPWHTKAAADVPIFLGRARLQAITELQHQPRQCGDRWLHTCRALPGRNRQHFLTEELDCGILRMHRRDGRYAKLRCHAAHLAARDPVAPSSERWTSRYHRRAPMPNGGTHRRQCLRALFVHVVVAADDGPDDRAMLAEGLLEGAAGAD